MDVRAHRPSVAWAPQSQSRLADHAPTAAKGRGICAHLNPPKGASLSEAFEPAAARRLAHRLELPHTPKPGSWVHSAAIELRGLSQPCLTRRLAELETLRHDTKAWEHERHAQQTGVDWQLTTEDARMRLTRLSPQSQG